LSNTCILTRANQIIKRIQNTYELTEAPVLSLPVVGAAVIEVVAVEASIADVNSCICLGESTTPSAI